MSPTVDVASASLAGGGTILALQKLAKTVVVTPALSFVCLERPDPPFPAAG
jgi:hypothetical protein